MLDAAGPALALETVAVSTALAPTSDEAAATPPVANLNGNTAPSDIEFQTPIIIDENGVATLALTFTDPDLADTHTIKVDWQDGTTQTFSLAAGVTSFSTTHQYLDDNLPGPATEDYDVTVRVTDSAGEFAEETSKITVLNVAPSNLQVAPLAPINENGVATLNLSFDDPGTLDEHTVEVDWGDGSAVEVFTIPTGDRSFSATHKYFDDNPTGTASDQYQINVKLIDDDLGETTATAVAKVNNVAPFNLQIQSLQPINENGVVTLSLGFNDPGTLDNHQVEIDWGDGTVETVSLAVGVRNLAKTHQYLDDNPTGTSADIYTVNVKVRDDDGGQATASDIVQVSNVAPSNVQIKPIAAINENGVATLELTFDDPGTLDSHTVEVNWGDGTIETLNVTAGTRTLTATHQYLDDNPTGTAADVYTVNVKVRDDDGGQATASSTVQVANVAPNNVVASPVGSIIDEGGGVTLDVTFDDPGSQDTHQVEITWGDGHVTTGTATGHTFTASHVYADNGTYAVFVKVIDDDGGVGNGSAAVFVKNVAPTMTVVGPQTVNEGSILSLTNIGQFTDPGFNNPLNAGNILNGGETTEEFTYEINWGDGSATESGVPTIDQVGGVGTPTAGSFDASHIYADNGVYTVTVTVRDDDGGEISKTFLVTVNNVDPSLTLANPNPTANEGSPVTLAGLGVGATDPGFKNDATGTNETLIGESVDWGDGTGPQSLSIVTTPGGGPTNAPTTGTFSHATHYYADNGTYTVTVRMRDDDGSFVNRTFTVVVNNVAPSLTLTDKVLEVNEGAPLILPDLGAFTDPGFDNPANAGNGETEETFYYTIDWGDGTGTSPPIAVPKTNGGPNVLTTGNFANSHTYLDNDADNKYTITVTLFDDDGGSVTKSIDVTVFNVKPTITSMTATDVNTKGETTLTIVFEDPGADDFTVEVDWGDGNPPEVITVTVEERDQRTFQHTHTYEEPPNNSAADIKLTARVRDDDFNKAGIQDNSPSDPESVEISQPGLGAEKFRIDTTPQVAILTFPDRQVVPLLQTSTDVRLVTVTTADDGGGGGDTRAASERFLELRVINPDGSEGAGYRLPAKVLNNLPALFRNLPDNHYKIYLVQSETNARRLVIEVFVRNGKLIDPGDDSEGARDRPPTEESTTLPTEEQPAAGPAGEAAPPAETPIEPEPQAILEGTMRPRSSSAVYHSATLAGVAIALSGAGKQSIHKLEEAIARAKPDQWKRLRSAGTPRPKKPR